MELCFPEQAEKKEVCRLQIEDPYFLGQIIEMLRLDSQKHSSFSLQKALNREIVKNTNFLKIIAKDSNPRKAADIANTILLSLFILPSVASKRR